MTLPTYSALIPDVIAWAANRGLLHPDGTANKATPEAQHRKTMEEIGEASLEMQKLAKTAALADRLSQCFGMVEHAKAVLLRRHQRLALELGDVLVTLVLQSASQSVAWDECLRAHSSQFPTTWQFVDIYAGGLATEIANSSRRPTAFIGAVAQCVEDTARIELAMSGPECLSLALAKIQNRQGRVVDGVFVKA